MITRTLMNTRLARTSALFVFLWLGCFFVTTNILHAAEPACPDWVTSNPEILEQSYQGRSARAERLYELGPPFTTPAWYWNRGVWFRMPIGYLNPWPLAPWKLVDREKFKEFLAGLSYKGFDPVTEEFNAELITRGGLDYKFAFWMPSLRYVERNRWHAPSYRPCESGRPPPSEDEYTVMFRIEWPFLPGSGESDAARWFRIAAERLAKGEPLAMQNIERFEHSLNGPISGTKPYNTYDDDGDLVVMLGCDAYVQGPYPNPLCGGYIWQRSSDLILYIRFPAREGQRGFEKRWKAPVKAAISFANQWRQ